MQRAVLARELSGDVDVLIAANPCFGLDFAAVAEIRAQIMEARNRGAAVLLVSEDLDEFLELADRLSGHLRGRSCYETTPAAADRHRRSAATWPGIEARRAAHRGRPPLRLRVSARARRRWSSSTCSAIFWSRAGSAPRSATTCRLLAAAIAPAARLLDAFRRHGLLVIHTQECHRPDLSDCPPAKRARGGASLRIGDAGPMGRILVEGEPGNDIIPALAPGPAKSSSPSRARAPSTPPVCSGAAGLRGITHLVFGGVTTEVCVQTTIREANDRGFECLLVEDATESYFPEFKAATLAMVRAQGAIVGWTGTADQVVAALARQGAGHG